MSEKEVIAYAITHAPKGVKGGPYEGKRGGYGDQAATLEEAAMWRGERGRGPDEEDLELARMTRDEVRWLRPDARVIRIVRKAKPSEASAVEVLREARFVLSLCTTERGVRRSPEYETVKRSGGILGYGATMQAASAAWAEMFDGTPQEGSQHTSGPAECTVQRTLAAIDRVLAASGPDPMPVVRAAMRYLDHGPDGRLGPVWVGFREAGEAYREAVDAYRKAGGK